MGRPYISDIWSSGVLGGIIVCAILPLIGGGLLCGPQIGGLILRSADRRTNLRSAAVMMKTSKSGTAAFLAAFLARSGSELGSALGSALGLRLGFIGVELGMPVPRSYVPGSASY